MQTCSAGTKSAMSPTIALKMVLSPTMLKEERSKVGRTGRKVIGRKDRNFG
jgi:hypothetical protein